VTNLLIFVDEAIPGSVRSSLPRWDAFQRLGLLTEGIGIDTGKGTDDFQFPRPPS
jgi:hypothetical protein